MGYARLLSNKPLLVNDTMRRPFSSTSSGNHLLSSENDIDIKLYEALGKNVVFALNKIGDLITKIVSTSYMMLEDVDKSSCTSSSSESDELSDDSGRTKP